MVFADFDTSQYPFVLVKFGTLNDNNDFEQYKESFNEVYRMALEKQVKFRIMLDVSEISVPGLSGKLGYLKKNKEFMKEKEHLSRQYIHKVSIVTGNYISKNLIKLMFKMRKPVSDYKVWNDYDQGLEWLLRIYDLISHIFI